MMCSADLAGEAAVLEVELVGVHVVDAELLLQLARKVGEAAREDAHLPNRCVINN